MTHAELSNAAHRPPGMSPAECRGELRMLPSPNLDDAQPGEGAIGERVPFTLWDCPECDRRIATVVATSGRIHIRNDFQPA